MAAIMLKGNGVFGLTKPRSDAKPVERDKKQPFLVSSQGKCSSSAVKHCAEACSLTRAVIYLMGPQTSERLAWRSLSERRGQEGEKGWKEEEESSIFARFYEQLE